MYKEVLVETTDLYQHGTDNNQQTIQQVDSKSSEKSWKYLGDFQKNILFIVHYENAVHIPDEQLKFLAGILTACKLSMADVAVLNVAKSPDVKFTIVRKNFSASMMILFGITPKAFEMPIDFPEFQVQAFNNCTFLFTPAIEEVSKDQLLKSKLWVSLRKMFEV